MAKNSNSVKKITAKGNKDTKWTKKKKIAAAIIAAGAACTVLFAIIMTVSYFTSVHPIKSTEEESRVVGECGGFEVKYEELRYVTLLHKQSLDVRIGKYDTLDNDGKAEYEAQLEKLVLEDLKSNYIILSLCEKYGIKTSSRGAKNHVNNEMKKFVGATFGGDMKKYKEWLAENNLTDSFVRLMYKVDYLESQLLEHFIKNKIDIEYDEDSLAAFADHIMESENWAKVTYAYYPKKTVTTTYNGETIIVWDEKNSIPAAEAAADGLAIISDDSERYHYMAKTVIAKAPFIQGYSVTGTGVYFTLGQMGREFESVAFELGIYETSEVVELEYGYYVIMRLPLEEDEVNRFARELLPHYQYGALKKCEDAKEAEISFVGNEYFDGLSLIDIE
ncbi:MAG: hypothetical protein E7592_03340 [Ruminococcaceae bacterium]|nr:hypothetical protein [Oscillospiraceae bacterium]